MDMRLIIINILLLFSISIYSQDILKNPYHYPASPIMTFDGVDDFISMSDIGAATIVSWEGTATPSKTSGTKIDVTVGTLWDILLSDGTRWIGCEGGGTTIYDVSANGNDATLNLITEADFWDARSNLNNYIFDYGYSITGNTLQSSILENSVAFPYTTFIANGITGFSAISDGLAVNYGGTADELIILNTYSYLVEFFLVLNSGALPSYALFTGDASGTSSNSENAISGSNSMILVATNSGTKRLQFRNLSTVTNYAISDLTIKQLGTNYPALLDGLTDVLGNPIGIPAPSKAPVILKQGTNILKN